jgi:Flp pilus assembly protein TadB
MIRREHSQKPQQTEKCLKEPGMKKFMWGMILVSFVAQMLIVMLTKLHLPLPIIIAMAAWFAWVIGLYAASFVNKKDDEIERLEREELEKRR